MPQAQWPDFHDDLEFRYLAEALQQELRATGSGKGVVLGGHNYRADHVRHSNQRFLELTRTARDCLRNASTKTKRASCYHAFNKTLRKEFMLYRLDKAAWLTAYYTPTVEVMKKKNIVYRFPIYGLPQSKQLRHASRWEIDFRHALDGQSLELYFARDRFDLYVLHIEGGGRLRVIDANGQSRYQYLTYVGDNDRPFHLLDDYMMEHNMLHPGDTSRFAKRRYLRKHPRQAEAVYASCPGYVFFANSELPPAGSGGVPLTAERSLAADLAYYPVRGLVAYITFQAPQLPGKGVALDANPAGLSQRNVKRFFLDQDKGPHIKGAARFDLFFGEGDNALFLANNLRTKGTVYFLMLK